MKKHCVILILTSILLVLKSAFADQSKPTHDNKPLSEHVIPNEQIQLEVAENIKPADENTSNSSSLDKTYTKKDILLMEIEELEKQILMSQHKVGLLREIRQNYLKENQTIPEISEELLTKNLEKKIPYFEADRSSRNKPFSFSKDDFRAKTEASLINKFLKRLQLTLPSDVVEVQYMPFKFVTQRTPDEGGNNYLIVARTSNSMFYIYDFLGSLLLEFNPGHHVNKFTTNPWNDEYFLTTLGDDGALRFFVIDIERIPIANPDNATAQQDPKRARFTTRYVARLEYVYETETTNLLSLQDLESGKTITPSNNINETTALISYNYKGLKYLFVGDSAGNVVIIQRNGTFKTSINIDNSRVISFQRYYSNLLVATEKTVVFVNPSLGQLASPQCDAPTDFIVDIAADPYTNSYFYALTKIGEILIYEVKQAVPGCKVVSKRSVPVQNSEFGKLYSLKNFLVYVDHQDPSHLLALNVTDPLFSEDSDTDFYNISLIQNSDIKGKNIEYLVQRNTFHSSHFCVFGENSNSSIILQLYEFNIPYKPPGDWLANLRIPIIIGAILLAFGYQFWMKKKGGGPDPYDKYKLDNEYKTERKGAVKSSVPKRTDINKLRSDLDNLTRNTKNFENSLGSADTSSILRGMGKGARFDDPDDGYENITTKKNK